ncbi:MAG: hypothetical protein ACNY01_02350 [Desulfobacteria bacterium]
MQTQALTNTDILEQASSIGAVIPFHEVSGKRTMTRPVKSIDRNVRLNRALWTLAQEMKTIKQQQSL